MSSEGDLQETHSSVMSGAEAQESALGKTGRKKYSIVSSHFAVPVCFVLEEFQAFWSSPLRAFRKCVAVSSSDCVVKVKGAHRDGHLES